MLPENGAVSIRTQASVNNLHLVADVEAYFVTVFRKQLVFATILHHRESVPAQLVYCTKFWDSLTALLLPIVQILPFQ